MLFGPPGAGKGTQADRLKREFSLAHLATGDILRQQVADGTALGVEAKRSMDSGALVPDAVVIGMIRDRLSQDGVSDAFLLDGFPRTIAQAEALDGMLAGLEAPIEAVISLAVPDDELARRLGGRWLCRKCGRSYHEVSAPYGGEPCQAGDGACDLYQRADDTPDAIGERLRVYERETGPVLDHYGPAGLVRTVDGTGEPGEVYARIVKAIGS